MIMKRLIFTSMLALAGTAQAAPPTSSARPSHVRSPSASVDLRAVERTFASGSVNKNGSDDARPAGPTEATRDALAYDPASLPNIALKIMPLAGHRSFATLQEIRPDKGWTVISGGNVLGVGTVATYGIALGQRTQFTPFVSLDYNRIDSARYVNDSGPRTYFNDNADTGLATSVGAVLTRALDGSGRARLVNYGAVIMSSGSAFSGEETGTVAGRILKTVGSGGPQHLRLELGTGADIRLSPKSSFRAGLVSAFDPVLGDTQAASISYTTRF